MSRILIMGVALTTITFLGRLWWGFELVTHFRMQYVILFSFLTVALLIKKRWRMGGVAAICTMIHLLPVLPAYTNLHKNSVEPASEPIKILFSNVRVKNTHYPQLLDLISNEAPDVVVLVEVNSAWLESLKPLEQIYPHRLITRGRHYERIVLYTQLPILSSQEKYFGHHRIPTLITTVNVKNRPLTIYTSHLTSPTTPNDAEARNEVLKMLGQEIYSIKEPAILVGDLNITPWSPYFYDFIKTTGWKDSRNGFGIQASWPTYVTPFLIPLDHCLVHPSVQVLDRRLGPNIGSDHYPVLLKLALSDKSQTAVSITHGRPGPL